MLLEPAVGPDFRSVVKALPGEGVLGTLNADRNRLARWLSPGMTFPSRAKMARGKCVKSTAMMPPHQITDDICW